MDLLFYRYRHVTVLLVVTLAQLGLLAYQVRNDKDVRLIRVWAVGAVTPLARVLDGARFGTSNFVEDYLLLLNVRKENQQLKKDLDSAHLEMQQMRAELETGDHAQALALFQKQTPMKTVPARILMNTTGSASAVFVDVGSAQGIQRGMAVITPGGIVGKITAVYPAVSMVLLINDPLFAAGVVSQKNRVQGTLRGQGTASPIVDFVQNEQAVDVNEWFYTSGNDFVFPRGLRVGTAVVVKDGLRRKDVQLKPSAFDNAIEEVLVITSGVHAPIPTAPPPSLPVSLQTPPPNETPVASAASQAGAITTQPLQTGPVATDADRLVEKYRNSGTVKSATRPAAVTASPASGTSPPSAQAAPSAARPPASSPVGPSVETAPTAPPAILPSAQTEPQPHP